MNGKRQSQLRLVRQLVKEVPEFQSVVAEHEAFNEDLLPHVLFGDLTRWVIDLYRRARNSPNERVDSVRVLNRALSFLEERFEDVDDEASQDLITLSFLENLGQAGPDFEGIRAQLGPALREGLDRLS